MAVLYFKNPETGAFEPLSIGGGGGSAIDDTTPSTVTVYSSKKTQDEIDRLDEQINEQKEANEAQDEEIAKRARDADLAAVAKSGSYNDLKDKPTIPNTYNLPMASTSVLGGVKVGNGLSIDASGVLFVSLNSAEGVSF